MMTPRERIDRIMKEIEGVAAQYNVTDWELQRLREWRKWEGLSDRQVAIIYRIEVKVFGEGIRI